MNKQEQEILRLGLVVSENRKRIDKLEEQRLRLEEVIEKQNDLIETLWGLYTDEQKPKH